MMVVQHDEASSTCNCLMCWDINAACSIAAAVLSLSHAWFMFSCFGLIVAVSPDFAAPVFLVSCQSVERVSNPLLGGNIRQD